MARRSQRIYQLHRETRSVWVVMRSLFCGCAGGASPSADDEVANELAAHAGDAIATLCATAFLALISLRCAPEPPIHVSLPTLFAPLWLLLALWGAQLIRRLYLFPHET